MKQLQRVPISSFEEIFGPPGNEKDFVKLPFPFAMIASWDDSLVLKSFYGHKYIGEAVIDALTEIRDYYGYQVLHDMELDKWGGCYANRQTITGKRKSIHAWGLAIDYLPHMGPYNKPSMIPYHIVNAFKKRGFVWGGDWSIPDAMHFSAVEE